jgi:hypothetical protein
MAGEATDPTPLPWTFSAKLLAFSTNVVAKLLPDSIRVDDRKSVLLKGEYNSPLQLYAISERIQ